MLLIFLLGKLKTTLANFIEEGKQMSTPLQTTLERETGIEPVPPPLQGGALPDELFPPDAVWERTILNEVREFRFIDPTAGT